MSEPVSLQTAFAIGLHVVGEDRAHQQRHMAADVVEDVRLLEIIKLVAAPDEAGRREPAAREMSEEYVIRDEARYRDDPPPGGPLENIAKAMKIGNAVGRDAKPAQPFKILAAGSPDQ